MGQVLFAGAGDRTVFDIAPTMTKSYELDWSRRLACNPADPADTIIASAWTPDVVAVVNASLTATTTLVTVSAAAAVPGHTHRVLNQITTADAQVDEWPIYFRIREN